VAVLAKRRLNLARMRHVFVETNWVVEYAAPAHRKTPAALELLDRAAREEIRLYLPVICVTEARRPVAERFQVGTEVDRVRQFFLWARDTSIVDAAEDETTRRVLIAWKVESRRISMGSMSRWSPCG
jgi:hypothetical protein